MIFALEKVFLGVLTLFIAIFTIWFTLIETIYENKSCYSILSNGSSIKAMNTSVNVSSIDKRLKLNHFTVLGTHNSFHLENIFYKYQHENLGEQLMKGIRQIELDIHLMNNDHLVYHVQLLDDKTNCYCFRSCLNRISQWNLQNPYHFPIYLFIEIKQMFYEDLVTGLTGGVKCRHFEQIKQQIFEVISLEKFILPALIQGNQTSIQIALRKQRLREINGDFTYKNYGWPPILQSLGKIVPIFIDDVRNVALSLYSVCDSFRDFFFVAQNNPNLPYSSIISSSNLVKDEQMLIDNVNNGFIIRTLLGYGGDNLEEKYQIGKKFGIHIISTDSIQCNNTFLCQFIKHDFQNETVLCNEVYAPSFCKSSFTFF